MPQQTKPGAHLSFKLKCYSQKNVWKVCGGGREGWEKRDRKERGNRTKKTLQTKVNGNEAK